MTEWTQEEFHLVVGQRNALYEALSELVALQNGPPLISETERWEKAMALSYVAINDVGSL
jgi:hypothetical protein